MRSGKVSGRHRGSLQQPICWFQNKDQAHERKQRSEQEICTKRVRNEKRCSCRAEKLLLSLVALVCGSRGNVVCEWNGANSNCSPDTRFTSTHRMVDTSKTFYDISATDTFLSDRLITEDEEVSAFSRISGIKRVWFVFIWEYIIAGALKESSKM